MNSAQSVAVNINILAYNEADFIESCLQSVLDAVNATANISAEVRVICNGCRDNTLMLADAFCAAHDRWQAVEVELGDKANAWNVAIEQSLQQGNKLTLFLDGDCLMGSDAIQSFIKAERQHPYSYILAGVPSTKGRSTRSIIFRTLRGEALSGNLYALTPAFLDQIAARNFRLPTGLIGDDSLLAWTASHDFALSNGFSYGYLIGCIDAKFRYHRLTPTSLNNLYLYLRRLMRYSLRHLQQHAIREHLNQYDRFETLPSRIDALYDKVALRHLRISWLYSLFDMINFIKIRKTA